jgi:hypothetical protein
MTPDGGLKEQFSSCWVGERLLPIANACMNSFKAHGFPFRLYTYGCVGDVPAFVERSGAEWLVPARAVFVAHGGLETFADLFCYRFLESVGGWWVDSDVVCNTDSVPDVDIAFAEEREGIINNAILKFPQRHPAIVDLLEYITTVDPVNSAWGSTGPLALTKVFQQHDLRRHQRPTADFYPLHWKEAPKLLLPEFTVEVRERAAPSPFIHLWGATLREIGFDFKRSLPLAGSYLDLVYSKYLDADILAQLQPLDEGLFRKSVQEYVEQNWHTSFPLT